MTRPEERFAVDLKVYITWEDEKRVVRRSTAHCVDISASGARLEMIEPLPKFGQVTVSAENFTRMGHAVVRYCLREGMKYRVGLQFTSLLTLSDSMRREAVERAKRKAAPAP